MSQKLALPTGQGLPPKVGNHHHVSFLIQFNIRHIMDYLHLFGYLKDLCQQQGIAGTINFDHIIRHYYIRCDDINPAGMAPLGPNQNLFSHHGRERL